MNTRTIAVALTCILLAGGNVAHGQASQADARGDQSRKPAADQRAVSDEMREQAESRQQEAEAAMAEAEANSRAEASRPEDAADEKGKTQRNTRGNETAAEMRARRDERKAIRESYSEEREPGTVAADAGEAMEDGEEQAEKAKKPWWKFWGE